MPEMCNPVNTNALLYRDTRSPETDKVPQDSLKQAWIISNLLVEAQRYENEMSWSK
jgi:hypothetical protein